MTTRRIGVFGGTFDPIHCGHIDIGLAAESTLRLTRMFVIPANVSPLRAPLLAPRMAPPPVRQLNKLDTLIFLVGGPTTDGATTALREQRGKGLPVTGPGDLGGQAAHGEPALDGARASGRRGSDPPPSP